MELRKQPVDKQQSLLTFNQSVDLCLTDIELLGVHTTFLTAILRFANLKSLSVDGLISSRSHTNCSVLAVDIVLCEDNQRCVRANNMHFSDSILGGAFIVQDGDVQLSNSTFSNLQGKINLFSPSGSSAIVSNCRFINLTTISIKGDQNAALYSTSPHIAITNCSFLACNASGTAGGAVRLITKSLQNGSWPVYPDVRLENSVFANNTSNFGGGAIFFDAGGGFSHVYLYLNSCTFCGNTGFIGGAIAADGLAYMGVVDCLFQHNQARFGKGGAVYSFGTVQQLTNSLLLNSSFLNNSHITDSSYDNDVSSLFYYDGCGGAYFEAGHCLGVYDCTFAGNQGVGLAVLNFAGLCEADQGTIEYQRRANHASYQTLFNRSTVSSAGVPSLNAFLGADSISVDIRESRFVENTIIPSYRSLQDDGGVQYLGPTAGGDALYLQDINKAILVALVVADNQGFQGSGLYLDSCNEIVVWNSVFARNIANSTGGAIAFVNAQNSGIMVGNCTLRDNQAIQGGGFYSDSRVALILTNGTVLARNAAGDGGGIYCLHCKQVTAQLGAIFNDNAAVETGGACYCEGCSLVQLAGAQLKGNRWVLAHAMHDL